MSRGDSQPVLFVKPPKCLQGAGEKPLSSNAQNPAPLGEVFIWGAPSFESVWMWQPQDYSRGSKVFME